MAKKLCTSACMLSGKPAAQCQNALSAPDYRFSPAWPLSVQEGPAISVFHFEPALPRTAKLLTILTVLPIRKYCRFCA